MHQRTKRYVRKSIRFSLIASAATLLAAPVEAEAGALAIWSGNAAPGTSTSWGIPTNWVLNTVPPTGAEVWFDGDFNSGLSISLAGANPVDTLNIKATKDFTITPNSAAPAAPLEIMGSRLRRDNNAAGTQTIAANLLLAAGNQHDWRIEGAGALVISGNISGGRVVKEGDGLLVWSGTNTHERTTVNRGTLQFTADASLGAAGGTLTLANAAIRPIGTIGIDHPLNVQGTGTIDVAAGTAYVQGGLHGAGELVKTGPGRIRMFGLDLNTFTGRIINKQGQMLTNHAHLRNHVENHGELQLSQNGAGSYTTNISGSGYVLLGGGAATFTGNNTFTGGMIINDTTVSVSENRNLGAANGTVTLNNDASVLRFTADFSTSRPIVFNTGTNTIHSDGDVSELHGPLTGPGNFVKTGSGRFAIKNVRTGGLIVNGGGIDFAADTTPAGTGSVSIIATSGPTSQIDLAQNHLIVDHAAGDNGAAFNNVAILIAGGRNGGAWNGGGLISSSARTDAPGTTGLGMIASADYAPDTFGGLPVDESSVLVKYTRLGDANLDGTTNINDFAQLAANFNQSGGWNRGDFNYDFTANISDFALLAANFNQSVSPAGLPRPGAVPEPAGIAMFAIASLAAGRRSRRRA
jgi:hypothetical protein